MFNVNTLRQLLVLFGSCLFFFTCGVAVTFPAVLIPDLLSPHSAIKASFNEISWIAMCPSLSGLLGHAILSPIFQEVGRKSVNIIVNILIMVGWIIFYFANSVAALIWARLVHGLAIGGIFVVGMSLSECSLPSRRGYFMCLKNVFFAFGSLSCDYLGLVTSWRYIAAFSTLFQCASLLVIMPCPESPAYLAMTGKFDECRKSFRWLFGQSMDTEKDLKELISAQMKIIDEKKRMTMCQQIKETASILLKKDFQKPFYIVVLSNLTVDVSDTYSMFYMMQILREITEDTSVSKYSSFAGYCLLIFAFSLSCFMVKIFTRRTLIFRFGFLSVLLMFLVSVTTVIKPYLLTLGMSWLTSVFVLLHCFVANLSLIPVTFAVTCEIFPLEYKGLGSYTTGIVSTLFYILTIKLTPLMIIDTGIEVAYAINGAFVMVFLGLLFFLLPETKDRTLQDIEDEIRDVKPNVNDVQFMLKH